MGRQSIGEYLRTVYARYRRAANRRAKQKMLDEFCANTGYHRKHALRLLNGPPPSGAPRPAPPVRWPTYGREWVSVLKATWRAAGYPWSVRLKALIPCGCPGCGSIFNSAPRWSGNGSRSARPRSTDDCEPIKSAASDGGTVALGPVAC